MASSVVFLTLSIGEAPVGGSGTGTEHEIDADGMGEDVEVFVETKVHVIYWHLAQGSPISESLLISAVGSTSINLLTKS